MSSLSKQIILFCIWLILFILGFNFGTYLLSIPNTIGNICGFIIIVVSIIITFETNCLTKFYKKK